MGPVVFGILQHRKAPFITEIIKFLLFCMYMDTDQVKPCCFYIQQIAEYLSFVIAEI